MENFKNVEKPKNELIQKSLENSTEKIETLIKKKDFSDVLNIEINEEKIPLEYTSSNFEYPKSIQKETGIISYKRNIISEEQINKFINNLLKLETGIKDEEFEKYKRDLLIRVIFEFSEGRFPDDSFTHQMGLRVDNSDKEFLINQFKAEKFILQDIFSIQGYEDVLKKSKKLDTFKSSYGANPDVSVFDLFDKETGKIIGYGSFGLILKKYKNKIKNKEAILVSANGLNVGELAFFFGYDPLDKNIATFGFDRQDKLFQDYMDKSIDYLRKLNNVNKIDSINYDDLKNYNFNKKLENSTKKEYQPKLYSNAMFLELFALRESEYSKDHLKPDAFGGINFLESKNGVIISDTWKKLVEKYGSAFSDKSTNKEVTSIDYNDTFVIEDDQFTYSNRSKYFDIKKLWPRGFPQPENYPSYEKNPFMGESYSESASYHLPIFINSDEIRQLKWGNASYSTFWTEKGFNFLEIKHSDNFPKGNEL